MLLSLEKAMTGLGFRHGEPNLSAPPKARDEVLSTSPSATEPQWWRSFFSRGAQVMATGCLALALLLSSPSVAEAARSSGRMGGSSFRAARSSSPSYSAPSYRAPSLSSGSGRGSTSVVIGGPTAYGMSSFFFPTYGMGYGYGLGGGGGVSLLFTALAAFIMFNAVSGMLSGASEDTGVAGGRCSVVKLQVGLLGMARSLQKDLDRIATRADTSNPDGLQYVLQETVLALMRNPDFCVYGHSSSKRVNGLDEAESRFNQLSLSERGKLKGETLSNYAGNTKRGSHGSSSSGMSNELIVVTVLVATDGRLKLPDVSSLPELKEALSQLGSVPADNLLAVEVLWTPQEDGDSFTQDELITDYPHLNAL